MKLLGRALRGSFYAGESLLSPGNRHVPLRSPASCATITTNVPGRDMLRQFGLAVDFAHLPFELGSRRLTPASRTAIIIITNHEHSYQMPTPENVCVADVLPAAASWLAAGSWSCIGVGGGSGLGSGYRRL